MDEFKYPKIVNFFAWVLWIVRDKLVHDRTGETIIRCYEPLEGPAGMALTCFAIVGAIERVKSYSATITANNGLINFSVRIKILVTMCSWNS